jgi:hypothetical protein
VIRSPEALEIAFDGGRALSARPGSVLARAQIENLSGKAAFDALRRLSSRAVRADWAFRSGKQQLA